MLTYDDCLELCDFSQQEIDAIAEYERINPFQALAEAQYLIQVPGGERRIRQMIIADIRRAQAGGRRSRARELRRVLVGFIRHHPHPHPHPQPLCRC